ncbi:hypothetical protein K469DRAFT_754895 [Zopfia rhizophila CBS 207.26]|uniref:Uncharacterized protein n=1 Tax=Zopfia rhizophila CBS 207.26 TaxID=1314779 RepID=A0A6A6DHV3_9PEZI|nr:hypothetical protein K469DRAFT_754895 [Zopfia rhizophila CBS 207.26]
MPTERPKRARRPTATAAEAEATTRAATARSKAGKVQPKATKAQSGATKRTGRQPLARKKGLTTRSQRDRVRFAELLATDNGPAAAQASPARVTIPETAPTECNEPQSSPPLPAPVPMPDDVEFIDITDLGPAPTARPVTPTSAGLPHLENLSSPSNALEYDLEVKYKLIVNSRSAAWRALERYDRFM